MRSGRIPIRVEILSGSDFIDFELTGSILNG